LIQKLAHFYLKKNLQENMRPSKILQIIQIAHTRAHMFWVDGSLVAQ